MKRLDIHQPLCYNIGMKVKQGKVMQTVKLMGNEIVAKNWKIKLSKEELAVYQDGAFFMVDTPNTVQALELGLDNTFELVVDNLVTDNFRQIPITLNFFRKWAGDDFEEVEKGVYRLSNYDYGYGPNCDPDIVGAIYEC